MVTSHLCGHGAGMHFFRNLVGAMARLQGRLRRSVLRSELTILSCPGCLRVVGESRSFLVCYGNIPIYQRRCIASEAFRGIIKILA